MPDAGEVRVALYPDGYHMLTRYTGSRQVIGDIAAWLAPAAVDRLPSGNGHRPSVASEIVCNP